MASRVRVPAHVAHTILAGRVLRCRRHKGPTHGGHAIRDAGTNGMVACGVTTVARTVLFGQERPCNFDAGARTSGIEDGGTSNPFVVVSGPAGGCLARDCLVMLHAGLVGGWTTG